MPEQEISALKNEIHQLRVEMRDGFAEFRAWKTEADIGALGLESRGIWGHSQKIAYNKKKVAALQEQQATLARDVAKVSTRIDKVIFVAIGGAAVSGTLGAIIFTLILNMLGG